MNFALTLGLASLSFVGSQARAQGTISSFEDVPNVQQDVFYRGTDQHVYLRYYTTATRWQSKDVTTLAGAPLTAPGTQITTFKDEPQNQQHVVFEAANGHIYQAYSNSNVSAWALQDITAITGSSGAAIGTPLASFVNNYEDIQYIFYMDTNQHVNLLYWHGGWAAADITAASGVPAAAAGTQFTGFLETNTSVAHVVYEGTDQHLHELYAGLDPTKISTTDLTTSSGGTLPATASSLSGFFNASQAQGNVFYVGVDAHVHHVSTTTSRSIWAWEDLTAKSGGAAVRSGTALTSFLDVPANQAQVFYVGSDLSLRRIYGGKTWSSENISSNFGVVLPVGGTPLSSFKDDPDSQLHVFYVGFDGSFQHLYYTTRWNPENLSAGTTLPVLGSLL